LERFRFGDALGINFSGRYSYPRICWSRRAQVDLFWSVKRNVGAAQSMATGAT